MIHLLLLLLSNPFHDAMANTYDKVSYCYTLYDGMTEPQLEKKIEEETKRQRELREEYEALKYANEGLRYSIIQRLGFKECQTKN